METEPFGPTDHPHPFHERVKSVFLAVCDLDRKNQRIQLQELCGSDPALMREVERLLENDIDESLIVSEVPDLADEWIGRTLTNYKIVERIGEGGMGVVYRGEDVRLKRPVAIKLLAPRMLGDESHRERFLREAQAAASLQHPAICTVYDIGEARGRPYIVTAYLAGETLESVIRRHHQSFSSAIDWAIQLAEGLQAAHAKGVVHRDLKPSNVILTSGADGATQATIIDFGLAQVNWGNRLTQTGRLIGTANYICPQFLQGVPVAEQADIWSLGVILYEMIAGRPPFDAEKLERLFYLICNQNPTPLTSIRPGLPPEVARIAAKALEKDADLRYCTVGDLLSDLRAFRQRLSPVVHLPELSFSRETTIPPGLELDSTAPESAGQIQYRKWIALGLIGILIPAVVAGVWFFQSRPAHVGWRLKPLTADSGLTTTPAISADGRLAAYASDRASNGTHLDLWIQPLSEASQPLRLTQNPADNMNPSFSPDGGQIAFFSSRDGGGIYVIPAFGGQERLLVRGGRYPRFSPDGRWVAYSLGLFDESQVFIIPVGGGIPTRIAADIAWATAPVWSPDGRRLLVLATQRIAEHPPSEEFWLVSPEGGASVKTGLVSLLRSQQVALFDGMSADSLIMAALSLDWIGDHLFFGSGTSIWSISFKNGSPKPGELRNVASGTTAMAGVRGLSSKLLFESRTGGSHLWSLPLDLNSGRVQGTMRPLTHAGGNQTMPVSSHDGTRLVYVQNGTNSEEIRVRDMSSGSEKTLIIGFARPKISPDGTKVAYVTGPKGPLFLMDSAGGEATKLLDRAGGVVAFGWSADGKRIVYWDGTPVRFSTFNRETHQTTELISHPTYSIHGAELSRDGKWLAFHLPRPVSEPLKIAPVRDGKAAGEAEWITVAEARGFNRRPWWSPNGNLLYFLSTRDNYACIWAQPLDASTKQPRGEPIPVFHFHDARRLADIRATNLFGPAVGQGSIVFALAEQTGNIWFAEPTSSER